MVRARNVAAAAILGAMTLARVAGAQAPVGDAVTRAPRADVRSLRPSEFVYQTTIERDVSTILLGTRTVTVLPTMYSGAPAWLLLETRAGDGIPATDSLVADMQSLHPIHWSSTLGRARVGAEFRGDSAFGGLSAPATRRSIVVSTPPGTLISS
ncbi:MAG TPA: hypothetical protein VGN65_04435, partial [Casimicrobiaceae bacterium]